MTTERKRHHPIRRAKAAPEAPAPAKSSAKKSPPRTSKKNQEEEFIDQGPRRERRALSHVGGEVSFRGGSEEEQAVLLHALDVSAEEEEVMEDVHGFHSYPARLHPVTARRLIEGFSKKGARVLDPFCGSGTVVVESRALGRNALGSDLNPLAVELSWLKSRGPTKKLVSDMLGAASSIAEIAEERRLGKADPYRRYDPEDRERYPVHILLELDSLAHGIGQLAGVEVTRMLRLVVSSTLTKLAHSEGDTTRRMTPRRLPGGFAIQLFQQKAEELAARLDDYRERIVDKSPRAHVTTADARDLGHIESDSVDLIITSPPYPGVYDYLDHHMHRIRWLGLRDTRLREGEIGARREYRSLRLQDAAQRWRDEIGPTLYELRRTLADDGRGILIIADSVADRQAMRADEQIHAVAEKAGIDITCIASQERPLFLHGAERAFVDGPRMEHVVVFRPSRQIRKKHDRKKDVAKDSEERVRPERFQKFDEAREAERPARQAEGARTGYRTSREQGPRGGFRGPTDKPPREGQGPNRGWGRPDNSYGREAESSPERRSFRSGPERSRSGPERSRPEGQRDSQARTWDSSPRGASRPRSKSDRNPK